MGNSIEIKWFKKINYNRCEAHDVKQKAARG